MSFTYQWRRCDPFGASCVDVVGATSSSYVLTDADLGSTMRAVVTDGVTTSTSGPSAIIGPSGWVPAPPSSYASSGTVSTLQIEASELGSGDGLGQATFHPNWQHVTQTPSGDIFCVYLYSDTGPDSGGHTVTYFRVKWSANSGASFTTIYDSNNGVDPNYGISPAIESDSNGNVYVIANHSPRPSSSSSTQVTYLHKFSAPYNQAYTHASTTIATINQASGKFSALLDQERQWIWICFWENVVGNLLAYDLSGNLQKTVSLFNTAPYPETYANASYPCLAMARSGRLITGWTCESTEFLGVQGYYDGRFIYSDDVASTFVGPTGAVTLPVWADNSGASGRVAFQLSHPGYDFLAGSNAGYGTGGGQHYNWNHLYSLAWNNNKLHGYYSTGSSSSSIYGSAAHPNSHPYVRWDPTSGLVDYRREPDFNTDAGLQSQPSNGMGSFVQDTSGTARLYFVTGGRGAKLGKITVFKCDAPAATTPVWTVYAEAASSIGTANGLLNIGPCRYVQSDGSIVGIVQQADSPYAIYFFRVV